MAGIEVDEMELEEARTFLIARASLRGLSKEEDAAVTDIVADLGCLPLMLDQAAAFIQATGVTLSTYLSYVKKKKAEIFKYNRHSAPGLADYQRSVETTWTISFEQIRLRSLEAAQLLFILAFLDHTLIWEGMLHLACEGYLKAGPETIPPEFPSFLLKLFQDDGYAFNIAMEELLKFSLVKRKHGNITIHPLVGHCSRQWATESELHVKQTIQLVAKALPRADHREVIKILPQIYKCCELSKQLEAKSSDITSVFIRMCIGACSLDGNVPLLLNSAEPFLDRAAQPDLALLHATWLAAFYADINDYYKALKLLEDTRKWAQELRNLTPETNAELGIVIIRQSNLYYVKGYHNEAEALIQSWSPLDPENPSPNEIRALGDRDRLLGRKLYYSRQFAEAERALIPALEREVIGTKTRAVNITYLSEVYIAQRRFDEVVALIKAELCALEINPLEINPSALSRGSYMARLKISLGEALIELHEYFEAKTLLSQLLFDLESREGTFIHWVRYGKYIVMIGLARIEHEQKNWKEAAELWKVVLSDKNDISYRANSREHVDLALISHDDAIAELTGAGLKGEGREHLRSVVGAIKRRQETFVEPPMFCHWIGFMREKLELRIRGLDEVSKLLESSLQAQPSPPPDITAGKPLKKDVPRRATTRPPWWKLVSRKKP